MVSMVSIFSSPPAAERIKSVDRTAESAVGIFVRFENIQPLLLNFKEN